MPVTTSAVLGLVCLALLSTTVVEVNSAPNTRDPAEDVEDDHCTYHGVKYEKGEEWSADVGACSILKCRGRGIYSAKTCPAVDFPAHCTQSPYDLTVKYPYCCPNVTCSDYPTYTETILMKEDSKEKS